MTNSDVLKEEFEKFMVDKFLYSIKAFDNNLDGIYWSTTIQNCWKAYQAAWETSRKKMEPMAYMIFNENTNTVITYKENKEEAKEILSRYQSVYCCKLIPLYYQPNDKT
ncbi:hypothetical protein [Xenorhabdus cabanillasii]|uniref:Uncharacterized protein n=1 Tax=Xenorhabdus cabanillasii JM26 TaxID=1427517 RepID=W1IQT3_9GAMM|nr:hypothetical protein [Xenorhabdus cabanillasii]PHM75902.1 hypothetical protein Xcab_03598 [Xenorhabdus cabanillasii JM26]CDL79971.1 hypothetical protein XCR1_1300017 [Xenorhabdus cabanillasii JM26]